MTDTKLNLAVFISGRGSNLQSIIDACQDPDFPARVSLVLSNKSDAYGLERARKVGIPTVVILHKDYPTREAFEDAMLAELAGHPVDLICLAGFMRILTPHFINRWPDKIINIHPSLLPDYKGLNTHERALADGKKEAGCTIHYVVPEMDSGPIIMQKRVPILTGDTPEILAARVLEQEHIAYPEVIRKLANKRS